MTRLPAFRRPTSGTNGLQLPRFNRRGVLESGLGASAAWLAHPGTSWAQEATPAATPATLTDEERAWLEQAERRDSNGWIHLKIGGAPFARGFQHGYLVAAEYAEAIRVFEAMTYLTSGFDYAFFVEKAVELQKSKIPDEQPEEMSGIAAGLTKAGVPTSLDDIIGWIANTEITGYWWPTVASQYVNTAPTGNRKSHCSAFIATGSATTDGRIVIGHETFTEFWNGQFTNVILDIIPDDGFRMVMQTSPGYTASMTDFWMTGGGIVVVEPPWSATRGSTRTRFPSTSAPATPASTGRPSTSGWN
jgi:hypothetical protein